METSSPQDRSRAILEHYEARKEQMSRALHPDDHMFKSNNSEWPPYISVGASAIRTLSAALNHTDQKIDAILDFGCGHGRVARHLPLAFPEASLAFSDIDETAWQFCAETFGGTGFPSHKDFSQLEIPGSYDLIWLGSVFTHLDWSDMQTLLEKFAGALNVGGLVVATVRGQACYKMMIDTPERFNQGGYYDALLNDYHTNGFGYMIYKGFEDWGQNLITPAKVHQLADRLDGLSCVDVVETGWANIHDVGIWKLDAPMVHADLATQPESKRSLSGFFRSLFSSK